MFAVLSLLFGSVLVATSPAALPAPGGAHAGSVVAPGDSTESFGDPISLDRSTAVDVGTVVGSPALHGKPVLVRGSIIDVCTNKGCWMVVTDGTTQMRVTFKDYGFFVPINSKGGTVFLQGVVSDQEVSEEDARHFASESTIGEKPEEIHGPQKVVTMVATGVSITR